MAQGSQDHAADRFTTTKVFAVVLSIVVAAYGFIGWANDGEWFKAIVCLVAQGLAINTAIAARRAFHKEKWAMGLLGIGFTGGFAMWSEQGLYHAWTAGGSEISPALTWFLCASEPILFWFTESVQRARKPMSPEEIAEAALVEARAQEPPAQRRANLRTIAGGLGAAAAIALAPGHGQAVEPVPHEPVTQRAPRTAVRNQEPDRAQAKLLLAQGLTAYSVSKATGVPLSTCKRWAKAA